jgi:hypothetical protein
MTRWETPDRISITLDDFCPDSALARTATGTFPEQSLKSRWLHSFSSKGKLFCKENKNVVIFFNFGREIIEFIIINCEHICSQVQQYFKVEIKRDVREWLNIVGESTKKRKKDKKIRGRVVGMHKHIDKKAHSECVCLIWNLIEGVDGVVLHAARGQRLLLGHRLNQVAGQVLPEPERQDPFQLFRNPDVADDPPVPGMRHLELDPGPM